MPEQLGNHGTWSDDGAIGNLLELLIPPAWHARAACREAADVATWFPGRGEDAAPAKAVCAGCAVRQECGSWAEQQGADLSGIWGGLSGRLVPPI